MINPILNLISNIGYVVVLWVNWFWLRSLESRIKQLEDENSKIKGFLSEMYNLMRHKI